MLTGKQTLILAELQENYIAFAKGAALYPVFCYLNFYWQELTELAAICPYVVYMPPNPKGNPMYETGKHSISASIMQWENPIVRLPAYKERSLILAEIACVSESFYPYPTARPFHFQETFMEAEMLLNIRESRKEWQAHNA